LGRDTWLAASGGLLAIVLVFVTVGSAYPAYLQVFLGETASVRAAFFVAALAPIALILTPGIGFAFNTSWSPRPIPLMRVGAYFGLAGLAGLLGARLFEPEPLLGLTLLGLAVASLLTLTFDLVRNRPSGRILAGHIGHIGVAVVLAGVAGSSLGAEFSGPMGPGDTATVGDYTVRLDRIDTGATRRFIFVEAEVALTRDGSAPVSLTPQIRAYEDQALPVPEPALHSTPREDVVVAISRVGGDASVVGVSVFVRPLVLFVWTGSLLIALAGLVALAAKGAGAARRRRPATAGQQPEGASTSR
jgi:cytochrome c-type biogenesis protein CcmF